MLSEQSVKDLLLQIVEDVTVGHRESAEILRAILREEVSSSFVLLPGSIAPPAEAFGLQRVRDLAAILDRLALELKSGSESSRQIAEQALGIWRKGSY